MTRVAVVMPARNAGRFISEAIRSVQGQTLAAWTMLVIDDGSTDGTAEAAEASARGDARIRVVRQPNLGIAHAMNRGLEEAGCDLVACMHADDVMLPERLGRQLEYAARHPNVAVFSSLVRWIDPMGRPLAHSRSDLTTPEAVRRKVAGGGCVAFPHPAVLMRREVILGVGGYRQAFFPAEDTELWNRVVAAGHGVLVQPEVLLLYRLHPDSASTSRAATMIGRLRWIEACIAARREGAAEPTLDQFLARRRALPWPRRVGQRRLDLGRTFYQSAIGHYAACRPLAAAAALAATACLEPELLLGRAWRRLRRRD